MTVHIPPYGGVFARGGYEWAGNKQGATYMVGARLDTVPSTIALAALLVVGLVRSAKDHDFSLWDFIPVAE